MPTTTTSVPTTATSTTEPTTSEPITSAPTTTTPTSEPTTTEPNTTETTPTGFVSRVTASMKPVQDLAGNTWAPRTTRWGTWNVSTGMVGKDVRNTEDDDLYRTVAWDTKWYDLPVPEPATYTVRLLLVDDWYSVAGKRVFDVSAEGVRVATDIDVAGTVGWGAAEDVTFQVPVADGELNLDFTAKVGNAMVSGIEVTGPTSQPAPSTEHPQAVTFAPDSFWTQDISAAPTAANSVQVVANLARTVADRYGGIAAFNVWHYNTSFIRVPAGLPRVTVGYHNCQNKDGVPWGLYDGPAHFVDVPVPNDAVTSAGTDGEVTVYDPSTDQLWQFWQMRRNTTTNGWEACWGGRVDTVSQQQGWFPDWFGASASGLVTAGGMVTMEDIRKGQINHLMALGVVESQAPPVWSWPAKRTDGTSSDPNVIMHGQRLRLDPSVDVDQLGLSPIGRVVAKAAQKYGFIAVDTSGAVALSAESGAHTKVLTGKDPWTRLLGGPDYSALKGFPWDKVQALPKDYWR